MAARQSAVDHVAPQRTPVSASELSASIGRAYTRVTGMTPTANILNCLSAQASVETAAGGSMYNFNFGGVKGVGPHGQSANCLTHEVVDGKDVTVRQDFRAYASLDEGAEDYVRLMTQRFGGALQWASTGSLDGFAHALKQAGYYTANEGDYAAALKAACPGASAAGASVLPVPAWPVALPTSVDVSRVVEALSASALKIADSSSSG
jgi:flagellar protein FlgJ